MTYVNRATVASFKPGALTSIKTERWSKLHSTKARGGPRLVVAALSAAR